MNVDGTDKQILTDDNANVFPEWTCDGAQIVYQSRGSIWMMNADGGDKRQIVAVRGGASSPSMSCNGKLVFGGFSDATRKAVIWILNDLTGTPRQISDENNFDASPRISPDGTMIVFIRYIGYDPVTQSDTARELFVMNADGTGVKQLTFVTDDPNNPNANAPAWSPDGKKISFFNGFEETGPGRTTPDRRNLAVINPDGTGKHLLTNCDVTTADIGDFLPGLFLFGHAGGRPWKF
jgi:Tol biopolymer transport system component